MTSDPEGRSFDERVDDPQTAADHALAAHAWATGLRSFWNTFCGASGDRAAELAYCATADAAKAEGHAAAARALAAVEGPEVQRHKEERP